MLLLASGRRRDGKGDATDQRAFSALMQHQRRQKLTLAAKQVLAVEARECPVGPTPLCVASVPPTTGPRSLHRPTGQGGAQ